MSVGRLPFGNIEIEQNFQNSIKPFGTKLYYITWKISPNLIDFDDEQFGLHFFRRLKTQDQNFDFGLFKLQLELKIAKNQYQSKLVHI